MGRHPQMDRVDRRSELSLACERLDRVPDLTGRHGFPEPLPVAIADPRAHRPRPDRQGLPARAHGDGGEDLAIRGPEGLNLCGRPGWVVAADFFGSGERNGTVRRGGAVLKGGGGVVNRGVVGQ